jgi:O-antigen/teichoic acid export membrane protein
MILVATLISGVGSYLYHPIMSRYLTDGEFARFESLAGMFVVLSTMTV